MPLPRSLARFNRVVTNRVQGLWAPRLPPWAVVVHRGRRTGRPYRTPVLAWRDGDRLVVLLFYGADTDWVRNVMAAGEATVVRAGTRWRLTGPQVVDTAGVGPTVPARVGRRLARAALVGTLVPG